MLQHFIKLKVCRTPRARAECSRNSGTTRNKKPGAVAGWWWIVWRWAPGRTPYKSIMACLSLQRVHGAGVQAACIHVAVVNQALHVVLHLLYRLVKVLGNLLHAVNGLALLVHMGGLG